MTRLLSDSSKETCPPHLELLLLGGGSGGGELVEEEGGGAAAGEASVTSPPNVFPDDEDGLATTYKAFAIS